MRHRLVAVLLVAVCLAPASALAARKQTWVAQIVSAQGFTLQLTAKLRPRGGILRGQVKCFSPYCLGRKAQVAIGFFSGGAFRAELYFRGGAACAAEGIAVGSLGYAGVYACEWPLGVLVDFGDAYFTRVR